MTKKCSERIADQWASTEDTLTKLFAAYYEETCPDCDGEGYHDEAPGGWEEASYDENQGMTDCELCDGTGALNEDSYAEDIGNLFEYGLSWDYVAAGTFENQERGYWRYQMSWGGPSDEIRFYVSHNGRYLSVDTAEYWFMDWFDGAKLDITSHELTDKLWDFFGHDASIVAL